MTSLVDPTKHILDFDMKFYPYWEDINEGILRQFPIRHAQSADTKPLVLDVGCGQGTLSEAIRDRGYSVWGVECDKGAVERGSERLDGMIESDLHDMKKVTEVLNGKKFDYLIFSDVLEHVYDPLGTLRSYSEFLKPGGLALISVPNIANWEARMKLFFGVFNYGPSGVMDRTHIRFFTVKSAAKMVQGAGLTLVSQDQTPYIVRAFIPLVKKLFLPKVSAGADSTEDRRAIIDSKAFKLYEKFVYPVESFLTKIFPGMFTFRIIVVAKKS